MEENRDIVEAEASTSPEHLYRLYDIDGNGYRELIIQTGDDGAFEIYYSLYDGDKVVGALSAGVILGSEDGTELELYAVTNEFDLYE